MYANLNNSTEKIETLTVVLDTTYLDVVDVFGGPYPFDRVAKLFNRVDKGADISCDVIEQVHYRHGLFTRHLQKADLAE